MASTRDYELIARALSDAMHATLNDVDEPAEWRPNRRGGIALAAQLLADALGQQNERFNRAQFLAASGAADRR